MTTDKPRLLAFADLTLDPDSGAFTRAGYTGRLGRLECALLALLLRNPGRAVTREQIHQELWPGRTRHPDRLASLACLMRRKMDATEGQRLVHAAHSGYVLREPWPLAAPERPVALVHASAAAAVTPKAVLAAVDGCGLDIAEAAGLLGISVERCRSLLATGRAAEAGAR